MRRTEGIGDGNGNSRLPVSVEKMLAGLVIEF